MLLRVVKVDLNKVVMSNKTYKSYVKLSKFIFMGIRDAGVVNIIGHMI